LAGSRYFVGSIQQQKYLTSQIFSSTNMHMCMTEYCQNLIFAVEQRFPHYFFIITPVSRYLYVLLFENQVSLSYPRQNVGLPQHKQLNWFFTNGKYLQKDEIPLHVHQWTGRSICKLKMNGLNFEDECFSLAGWFRGSSLVVAFLPGFPATLGALPRIL